jgi:hypothetical protein
VTAARLYVGGFAVMFVVAMCMEFRLNLWIAVAIPVLAVPLIVAGVVTARRAFDLIAAELPNARRDEVVSAVTSAGLKDLLRFSETG